MPRTSHPTPGVGDASSLVHEATRRRQILLMGVTMPPATEAITASLPPDRQGGASALNDTTREVGTAVGIALLGAVLAAVYGSSMKPAVAALPDGGSAAAAEGIGRAFEVAAQQSDDARGAVLVDAARQAFVDGWSASIWVGAAVIGVLLGFLALRAPRPAPRSSTEVLAETRA